MRYLFKFVWEDWKNVCLLFESHWAANLRAPFKPSLYHAAVMFERVLNCVLMMAKGPAVFENVVTLWYKKSEVLK